MLGLLMSFLKHPTGIGVVTLITWISNTFMFRFFMSSKNISIFCLIITLGAGIFKLYVKNYPRSLSEMPNKTITNEETYIKVTH